MNDYKPKTALRVMKMIFTAIFMSPLVLFVAFVLTNGLTLTTTFEALNIYHAVIMVLIALVIPATISFSNRILKPIKPSDPLDSRMARYQTAMIIRLAGWESLALVSIAAMISAADIVILAFFIIAMGGLYMNYPSIISLGKSIQLNPSEVAQLKQ